MSEAPDDAARLRVAAESEDIEAVRESWDSLRNHSLESLLADLATAVEQNRLEDARALFAEVEGRIETRRIGTDATTAAVRAARTPGDVGLDDVGSIESVEGLTDYLVAAEQANSQRLELLTRVGAFLTAPDTERTPDPSTVVASIERTANSEASFETATATVEDELSDREVPGTLAGLSVELNPTTVPTGSESTLSVSVRNVGNEVAEGVVVTTDLPAEVSGTPETVPLGTVAGGESRSATVNVTPSANGSHPLGVTVSSSDAGTVTGTVVLRQVDASEFSNPLVEYANEDGVVTTDGLRDAIGDWRTGEIGTELLREVIDGWRSGEPVV